ASRGYAMVLVDVRGTGASFGSWTAPFSHNEVMDDRDIVDWVIAQRWSNGLVGAIGTSYEGGTAQLVAAVNHPAVKAVIPRWEEFDAYTDIALPGGILCEWVVKNWGALVRELDNSAGAKPVDGDADARQLKAAVKEHARNLDVYGTVRKVIFRDDQSLQPNGTIDDFSLHSYRKEIELSGAAVYGWGSWLDGATADGVIRRFQ